MMKIERSLLKLVSGVLLLCLISFVKLQIAFGSNSLFFSGLNIVGPLIGLIATPWLMFCMLFLKKCLMHSLLGVSLGSSFSTSIPTLCAAWYMHSSHKMVRLFLPMFCMIIFMVHPVGSQAWVYAMYWLIPITIYFINYRSFFLTALAATFVQHAVGATIWMYTVPTTPALWYSLLPVVLIERLLFAAGMVVLVWVVDLSKTYCLQKLRCVRTSLFSF